ncbi:hypothetical protein DYU11_01620 [Fibrisoma montanum]|uniref:Uncharacterized protein n=1 Tax=Fibrisoma montanum TaxID=2305895 RepID=A0A418MHZ6_9BACT|nr:hypothetical protein [Fibrisoma montanum]RIV27042.1 hypothetical protein DYU11_01620 [Fibrisoma montanum]
MFFPPPTRPPGSRLLFQTQPIAAASSTATNRPINPFQVQQNRQAYVGQLFEDRQSQVRPTTYIAPVVRQAFAKAQSRKEWEDKALDIADKASLTLPIPYVGETVGVLGTGVAAGIRGVKSIRDARAGDYPSAATNLFLGVGNTVGVGWMLRNLNKTRTLNQLARKPVFANTPAQAEADAGAEWTKNWFRDRANASRGGLTPADARYADAIKRPVVLDSSTWRQIGKPETTGVYYSGLDISLIKPNTGQIGNSAAHEATHQFQYAIPEGTGARLNLFDGAKRVYERNDSFWNYWTQPKEMHARLMELRRDLGYKPTDIITKERLVNDLRGRQTVYGRNFYWNWPDRVVDWLNNAPSVALPVAGAGVIGAGAYPAQPAPRMFKKGGVTDRPTYSNVKTRLFAIGGMTDDPPTTSPNYRPWVRNIIGSFNAGRLRRLQESYKTAPTPGLKALYLQQITELSGVDPFAPKVILPTPAPKSFLPGVMGSSEVIPNLLRTIPAPTSPVTASRSVLPASTKPQSALPALPPITINPVVGNSLANPSMSDLTATRPTITTPGLKNKQPVNHLSTDLTRRVPGLLADVSAMKPVQPQAPPLPDWSALGTTAANVGKIIGGGLLASRPLPTYETSQLFRDYQREATARRNEGYSPEELNTLNNTVTSNYRAGVNTLSNLMGGGSNPGAVLSGLNSLGMQRQAATQSVLSGDRAIRRQNMGLFGQVALGDLNLGRQLFEDKLQRAYGAQQSGVALAQSGLKDLQDNRTYDMVYGPNGFGRKYQELLIAKEQKAAEVEEATKQFWLNQAKRLDSAPTGGQSTALPPL